MLILQWSSWSPSSPCSLVPDSSSSAVGHAGGECMWNKNAHSACEYEKMGAPFSSAGAQLRYGKLGTRRFEKETECKTDCGGSNMSSTKSGGRNTNHGNNSITSMLVFLRKK